MPALNARAVEVVRQAEIFFGSGDDLSADVVRAAARCLQAIRPAWRLRSRRSSDGSSWQPLSDKSLFADWDNAAADRFAHLASAEDGRGCRLVVERLAPVLGVRRASSLRVTFPGDTGASEMVAFCRWILEVPFLWGTAGFVFERAPTWGFMVDDEPLYARARRLWCVQILDPVLLRWDALNGLPGTNWVTVLSPGFTAAHGLMLDDLCAAIESLAESGVHHLRGSQGIAIAGGDCPLLGDINIGDNIGPYLSTSRVLRLLLLTGASVHAGPLHYPERWRSWLLRFVEPQAWLAGIGRR